MDLPTQHERRDRQARIRVVGRDARVLLAHPLAPVRSCWVSVTSPAAAVGSKTARSSPEARSSTQRPPPGSSPAGERMNETREPSSAMRKLRGAPRLKPLVLAFCRGNESRPANRLPPLSHVREPGHGTGGSTEKPDPRSGRGSDQGSGGGPAQRQRALTASATEPGVFAELYRRHAEDLLRYFARRTLDPEAAAELTAETFAQAFSSRTTYRDTGANGVAWLYGIAKHQLGRFFRSGRVDRAARWRLGMPERELPPADYERIEDLVDFAPIRGALEEALGTLRRRTARRAAPARDRGAAVRRGRAPARCSEQNARQRVSRGLRRLALALQERGLQPATESER